MKNPLPPPLTPGEDPSSAVWDAHETNAAQAGDADDAGGFTFTPDAGLPGLDEPRGWVRVEGGGLDQAIYVKFKRVGPAFRVTGLHVENDLEITARSLRFPLRAIADGFAEWWGGFGATTIGDDGVVPYAWKDDVATWAGFDMLDEFVRDHVPTEAPPRGRGSGAPTPEELRIFARMYLEEYAQRPHGAVTRSANRYGMHRVTAHQWIKLCRAQGLLPEEETP